MDLLAPAKTEPVVFHRVDDRLVVVAGRHVLAPGVVLQRFAETNEFAEVSGECYVAIGEQLSVKERLVLLARLLEVVEEMDAAIDLVSGPGIFVRVVPVRRDDIDRPVERTTADVEGRW